MEIFSIPFAALETDKLAGLSASLTLPFTNPALAQSLDLPKVLFFALRRESLNRNTGQDPIQRRSNRVVTEAGSTWQSS